MDLLSKEYEILAALVKLLVPDQKEFESDGEFDAFVADIIVEFLAEIFAEKKYSQFSIYRVKHICELIETEVKGLKAGDI